MDPEKLKTQVTEPETEINQFEIDSMKAGEISVSDIMVIAADN